MQILGGGGKLAASVTKAVTHVIVSDAEFASGSTKVSAAEKKGVPIVNESFVEVPCGLWHGLSAPPR